MKRLTHSNPCAQPRDAGSIPAVATTYDVYYYEGRVVEVVQRPRGNRATVLFVRDVETGMCFVAAAYKVVYIPRTQ